MAHQRYCRDDVQRHNLDGYGGPYYPAVKVKYYGRSRVGDVEAKFGCSEEIAERACAWAWNSGVHQFWEQVGDTAEHILGRSVTVYQAGRSGGWAVVEGLPPIESWDAVMLGRWRKFELSLRAEIDYLTSAEYVLDAVESNRWAEEYAEEFNFMDTKDGAVCLADVPRCLHCAGVVRQ